MELTTVGALLKFGMEMERRALEVYQEASENSGYGDGKEAFAHFADENTKCKALLENVYRDNTFSDMDVGVLEPISGLNVAEYSTEVELVPATNYADFLKLALDLESEAERFYRASFDQMQSQRRSMGRRLEKLAKGKAERRHKLESLLALMSS